MESDGNIRVLFPRKLASICKHKNITQSDLAELLGVPTSTMSYWVRGKSVPSIESVIRLCVELNISADWLLGIKDEIKRRKERT